MGYGPARRTTQTRTTTGTPGSFPWRAVHLIDVENLAGDGLPARSQVGLVCGAFAERIGVGPMDHVIVGCNHRALLNAWSGWPHARFVVRSGPDGADLELMDVIQNENIAARFTRVTIGSGDGIFAAAASALAHAGCRVTVASRRKALSRRLALAAQQIVYLDDLTTTPAPAIQLFPAA